MTTQTQLDAILHGAAFAEIKDRGFLRITGSDATRWLNGMVTNNIKDLAPGEGNYNFLLNAQGRIQGDCTIYREPGDGDATYLLETDSSQLETVQQTFDKFIIMDDVQLEPTKMAGLLVVGRDSIDRVIQALYDVLKFDQGKPHTEINKGKAYRSQLWNKKLIALFPPSTSDLIVEIWSPEYDQIKVILAKLHDLAVPEIPSYGHMIPPTLEALRVMTGTPRFGEDIRDRDLPQETAQTHALHFAKGCYLGQEIVERIRSRGQVHRTFTRFTLTGAPPTELPAPLEANGKPAGEITSVAHIGDTLYALGYARREALDTHATLNYPGGTATPLNPKP